MIADIIEDIKQAADKWPEMVDSLSLVIKHENSWMGFVFVLLWVLVSQKVNIFRTAINYKKHRALRELKELNEYKSMIPEGLLSVHQDEVENKSFELLTGIRAVKAEFRNKLIDLYESSGEDLGWVQIKRAMLFLDSDEDGQLYVKEIGIFDKGYMIVNYIFSTIILVFAAAIFIISLYELKNPLNMFALWLPMMGLVIFSMFIASQNWPIYDARRIEKYLQGRS